MNRYGNPPAGCFTVYRFYGADASCIYVGATGYGLVRIKHHQLNKNWWPMVTTIAVEHFESEADARARESVLIAALQPTHQTAHLHAIPSPPEAPNVPGDTTPERPAA